MTNFILKDENSNEVVNINVDSSQISVDGDRYNVGITVADGVATLGSFFSQFGKTSIFEIDGTTICTGVLKSISISSFKKADDSEFDSYQFSVLV